MTENTDAPPIATVRAAYDSNGLRFWIGINEDPKGLGLSLEKPQPKSEPKDKK